MKKSNKFVLGLALTAGIIGCFGTAFALYEKKAEDVEISIGKVTTHADSTAVIKYKLDGIKTYSQLKDVDSGAEDKELDLSSTKLSPDYKKVYIKVPLSFTYKTTDENFTNQDAVVGRFSVKVDIASAVKAAGDVTVSAKLNGYGSSDTYFTKNKAYDFFETTYTSTSDASVTKHIDTAVNASAISCLITIDMSNSLTDDKFFDLTNTLDGANAFDVALNWEPYKSQEEFDTNLIPNAYVRGDYSNWQIREGYQMVPNIFGSVKTKDSYPGVEWQYKILKNFTTIKVYDSSVGEDDAGHWIGCGDVSEAGSNAKIEDNGNATISKDESYNVYYTRYGSTGFSVTKNS